MFYRFLQAKNPRERFEVVRPLAFAHWLARKDGFVTLYEIAVEPAARGQGLGRLLIASIREQRPAAPIGLKTDCANTVSRAFYRRLGFVEVRTFRAKSGKECVEIMG